MIIRNKVLYALEILKILSSAKTNVTTHELAAKLGVSKSYVEMVISPLCPDYIEGQRGPGGGYKTSLPADRIFVGIIVDLYREADCENDPSFFEDIEDAIFEGLKPTAILTINDLIDEECHDVQN